MEIQLLGKLSNLKIVRKSNEYSVPYFMFYITNESYSLLCETNPVWAKEKKHPYYPYTIIFIDIETKEELIKFTHKDCHFFWIPDKTRMILKIIMYQRKK